MFKICAVNKICIQAGQKEGKEANQEVVFEYINDKLEKLGVNRLRLKIENRG